MEGRKREGREKEEVSRDLWKGERTEGCFFRKGQRGVGRERARRGYV